jgi:DNA-binding GntR family transcriptional regulator
MERGNLSHGLEDAVREMVVRGTLPAGERVNEVHLARDLRASRTPLREALTRLVGESFLEARPRLGFFVRPLSAAEVTELYPIRARLDPWALELAGVPGPAELAALADRNAAIVEAERDPERVIELDDAWHLALIERCANRTLIGMIRQMMWRTRRYEHAFFRIPGAARSAVAAHDKILAALRRRDLPTACRRLEANMTSAIPELVARLGGASA